MSNYDFQVLSQGTQISQKYLHESNLRNLITYRVYDTGAILFLIKMIVKYINLDKIIVHRIS